MTPANKAKAIYSNSRQLASQYDRKRQDVESNAIPMLYFPFKLMDKEKYDNLMNLTEKLLMEGDYEKLILISEEIMRLSLMGLKYYHNYYQSPLLILVTLSFLGWIVCLLKMLLEQKIKTQVKATKVKMSYLDYSIYVKKGLHVYFFILIILAIYVIYGNKYFPTFFIFP